VYVLPHLATNHNVKMKIISITIAVASMAPVLQPFIYYFMQVLLSGYRPGWLDLSSLDLSSLV
jgi:hypothetical protein